MWELRRIGDWTPYEMEKKYQDESCYVDDTAEHINIVEAYELPDKDILIGYKIIESWEDWENIKEGKDDLSITYKKLNQIELAYYPYDMNEENWY